MNLPLSAHQLNHNSQLSRRRILLAQNRHPASRMYLSLMILRNARVTLECCGPSTVDHLMYRQNHYHAVVLCLNGGEYDNLWTIEKLVALEMSMPIFAIMDEGELMTNEFSNSESLFLFPHSITPDDLCRRVAMHTNLTTTAPDEACLL